MKVISLVFSMALASAAVAFIFQEERAKELRAIYNKNPDQTDMNPQELINSLQFVFKPHALTHLDGKALQGLSNRKLRRITESATSFSSASVFNDRKLDLAVGFLRPEGSPDNGKHAPTSKIIEHSKSILIDKTNHLGAQKRKARRRLNGSQTEAKTNPKNPTTAKPVISPKPSSTQSSKQKIKTSAIPNVPEAGDQLLFRKVDDRVVSTIITNEYQDDPIDSEEVRLSELRQKELLARINESLLPQNVHKEDEENPLDIAELALKSDSSDCDGVLDKTKKKDGTGSSQTRVRLIGGILLTLVEADSEGGAKSESEADLVDDDKKAKGDGQNAAQTNNNAKNVSDSISVIQAMLFSFVLLLL